VEEKEIHDELAAIRGLMERSSKFISLSGLSGILAGVYALIGAGIVYFFAPEAFRIADNIPDSAALYGVSDSTIGILTALATLVLLASVLTAFILSSRQAKKKQQSMWGSVSRSLLFHMAVPLIAGGALVFILVHLNLFGLIVPVMLVFYGISLVSASNFTFTDVKYLGLLEIALGLIAACLPGWGLLFWAIGFGVLHIIYGSMMYLKYDR
jgi:hypothetical protein